MTYEGIELGFIAIFLSLSLQQWLDTNLGGLKGKHHCLPVDEKYLQGIVLKHVSSSMDLHDVSMTPREQHGLLVPRQDLGQVWVTKWFITNKIASYVGCVCVCVCVHACVCVRGGGGDVY